LTHPEHDSPEARLDCPACRADVAEPAGLDAVWIGVAATLWTGRRGWVERVVGRLLRSPALARVLVTTPSLVPSWLLAGVTILLIGVVVSVGVGVPVIALVAPAMAGMAIAYAYGPGTDPAAELSATMPISDRMVLLVRAVAVFGVYAGMGAVTGLLVPAATGITWLWLVPMATLATLSLAAATIARSATVGTMVGLAAWSITVLSSDLATGRGIAAATSTPSLLLAYAVVTAVSVAIVVINPTLRNGRTP
jgi:hypothetical protein